MALGDYVVFKTGTVAEWNATTSENRIVPKGALAIVVDDDDNLVSIYCGNGNDEIFDLTPFNSGLDDAPSNGSTYARKDGAWSVIAGFLSNVINTVTGSFGFRNSDFVLNIQSATASFGKKFNTLSYFEWIFESSVWKLKFWSGDNRPPETGDDYSQNINPTNYANSLVPLKYIFPSDLLVSDANYTYDGDNLKNQSMQYSGAGGTITIDSTFLEIGEEANVLIVGSNDVTFAAGTGTTGLISHGGSLTTDGQGSSVGIKKLTATTYFLNGTLV